MLSTFWLSLGVACVALSFIVTIAMLFAVGPAALLSGPPLFGYGLLCFIMAQLTSRPAQ